MVGCLSEIEDELEDKEIDVLVKLFKSNTFKSLLKVNKIVKSIQDEAPRPVTTKAFIESRELLSYLKRKKKKNSLQEALIDVLEDSHFQACLFTHDVIGAEHLIPKHAEISEADKDRTQIITIKRNPGEALGTTIRRNESTGKIVVARVLHGGAAHRSGLLSPEDEIYEVNRVDTSDLSLDGVVSLLSIDFATVRLKILPCAEKSLLEENSKVYLKAYFNYDPSEDPHIPCKEAGLGFSKGDILEILENNETRWWQARKYVDSNAAKIGLIPSKKLQEKRLSLSLWNPLDGFLQPTDSHSGFTLNGKSNSPSDKSTKRKSKKVKYQAARSEKFHTEEIRIYDEVTQVLPDTDKPRPVILLGSPGQGCEELQRRLIETDSESFASPITYINTKVELEYTGHARCLNVVDESFDRPKGTSRSRKPLEKADRDYHFLTRHEMEKAVNFNQLVNVETVKNHHFAINIESIAELQDAGKTCVISLTPEYIRNICNTTLQCCVIFLKAPNKERLREILKSYTTNSFFYEDMTTDEDLQRIISDSLEIENCYSDYFDSTLIQSDLETNLNQLYHTVKKMAVEPFWIRLESETCT